MPRRLPRLFAAALLAPALAACSLLGDTTAREPAPAGGAVEKPALRVAVLPSVEVAPLHLAIEEGYFRDEGISSVEVITVASGQASTAGLIGGDYDLAYSSYVPVILAQARGAADLRIVTDNSGAAPNTAMLVTSATSRVRQVTDLTGATIAVPAVNTLADLMVKSVLNTQGVDVGSVQWVPMSFADMPSALERGDITAAMMVEPFITQAVTASGATPLADLATGPTADLPFTAYAATTRWVTANPATVRAWQRTMIRATRAASDRSAVERVVVESAKVDPDIVALIAMPQFRATLDTTRIQRVADLMHQFGILEERFDVAPMLLPPPSS
ncbi:NitT/TauT family transport system substrate-binding protein [Amycolatopsis arida]|uniref:NitT/TauT family transport system substrate-binding protein n=1 Tax=Amycolatopsis arida TaxID=587909 RepID=A0A1I5LHI4_9PSEU|nr:ABC transporter substrate-binding protein [Amycolatopsis arida]TDX93721.1 NitT/TauT family transport system substrate-binding protein [Amycolatopsis arida]SFO96632.1 NitT/TauT family transport system substrate-binding protein [Amycolatopsis arida]